MAYSVCILILVGEKAYKYTAKLSKLDMCTEMSECSPLPSYLCTVTTPVNLHFWEEHLNAHEDKQFTQLIVKGLKSGFRIGFQRNTVALHSAKSNLVSAEMHPEIVTAYLDQELKAGRVALVGSEEIAQHLDIQVSPFGVIPKKGKPNKWRLILDLSSPIGKSVNDGISKEDCSIQYTSVSAVAAEVLKLGKGTQMGKMDIQQAYRNIPVAPADRRLLGMLWQAILTRCYHLGCDRHP